MRKELAIIIVTAMFGMTLTGCSNEEKEVIPSLSVENVEILPEDVVSLDESVTEVMDTDAEKGNLEAELSFLELSKRQFGFSSGAGGWGEEFTIEKDGYFTGKYHDSDMGSTGEDYENGTVYSSSYSGHFTDIQKVDEYTYTMKLADISYKEEVGTEEFLCGVRYIYTDAYCLGDNDVFTIYLPGTPLNKISEEVLLWIKGYNMSQTELTMIVIVDEDNSYGMYSCERISPLEDARISYETCMESYNYYGQLASEAYTTLEMLECATARYKVSDECLNYIWNLIRYNVDEDDFQQILAQQREWIKEKESSAESAAAQWGGGSFASVDYVDISATLTIERCKELIAYLE